MLLKKFQLIVQVVGCLTIGLLAVWGLLALSSSASPVWAAIGQGIPNLQHDPRVPNVLTYQGMLRQPDGTLLDGTYEMTFRLYNSPIGGDLKHTDVISNVVVRDGLFTVLLGDTTAIDPDAFKDSLYISVQVGTESEMVPRQRIAPVAYAVQLTDGIYVDESGQVGIGTTEPQTQLDVNGDATVSGNTTLNGPVDGGGTLTVTDPLSVSGDISWGGHLKSMMISEIYNIYSNPDNGRGWHEVPLTLHENSVCFLTRVSCLDIDSGGEWCTCQIDRPPSWTHWRLQAYAKSDDDSQTVCEAMCLQW